ncbi:MAG: membrane dipeptidase [Chloroflexota bacterium]
MIIDALQTSNWDRELFLELRAGGVDCVHVTVAVWESARETLSQIHRWYGWFREHDDLIVQATSAREIVVAREGGKTAVILGFQNSSPFEDDLGLVEVFYRLGVRVVQLTYNNQSLLGAGCYEPHDGGLTRYGKEVVRELNRLGMVVDLSHVGEQTTLDAIEFSRQPVAVTHANPKFLHNIPRNKSDRVLRALAERGGMFGCSLYPHLIGGRQVTLTQYTGMIARLADMIGVNHIGFGSDAVRKCTPDYLNWLRMGRWTQTADFGPGSAANPGWPEWQAWFQTPADYPELRQGLRDQGFSEGETAQIMGGNWLRFFGEVMGD